MAGLGRILIFSGLFITLLGVIFLVFSKVNFFSLGRLPGDILIQKKNWTFYFPLTTCILLSIILSIIFYFIFHFKR